MKKHCFICLILIVFWSGCSGGQANVFGDEVRDRKENILIIAGEGGPSKSMFLKTAETYMRENGGEIFEVHNGDEFISVIKDFVARNGKIDHLEYFGHGNEIGLYVNQLPNVNGGLYVNDPRVNEDFVAASIYEVDKNIFDDNSWIKFNGCNVAKGYPEKNNLAQKMANYFNIDVVAPLGPTEFSASRSRVDPLVGAKYLSPDYEGNVYLVPSNAEKGFIVIKPQPFSESGYYDVKIGHDFEEAVTGLLERGLNIGFEKWMGDVMGYRGEFLPYKNATYGDAVHFCEVVFGEEAECFVSGYEENDMIRNLHALSMLVDASGAEVPGSYPWYNSYISWANQKDLLTEDFVNRKWYTRAEMAQLSWNFLTNL